jgi:hypothetical protein
MEAECRSEDSWLHRARESWIERKPYPISPKLDGTAGCGLLEARGCLGVEEGSAARFLLSDFDSLTDCRSNSLGYA